VLFIKIAVLFTFISKQEIQQPISPEKKKNTNFHFLFAYMQKKHYLCTLI